MLRNINQTNTIVVPSIENSKSNKCSMTIIGLKKENNNKKKQEENKSNDNKDGKNNDEIKNENNNNEKLTIIPFNFFSILPILNLLFNPPFLKNLKI